MSDGDFFLGIQVMKLPIIRFFSLFYDWCYAYVLEAKWYFKHLPFLGMVAACGTIVGLKVFWSYGKPFITYGLF